MHDVAEKGRRARCQRLEKEECKANATNKEMNELETVIVRGERIGWTVWHRRDMMMEVRLNTERVWTRQDSAKACTQCLPLISVTEN